MIDFQPSESIFDLGLASVYPGDILQMYHVTP